jgi:GTP-binding protein Era
MMEQKINLKLWVKVRKEWRDSELMMKNFGYRKED